MNKIITLAQATFKNLIRDKILYNVLFIAFFLLAIGYWASLLVYGHQHRVMLHFGIMINSFATFGIAVSAGARIIHQETESRILYLTLSKPITRTQYWIGKLAGIAAFLALNLILLTAVLGVGLHLTAGTINGALLQATTLIWLEAVIAAAFALTISLGLMPSLTTMLSITFLFLAHNREQITYLKDQNAIGGTALNVLSAIVPNAQYFLIDTRAFYDLPLTALEWAQRFGYGVLWVSIFILIGNAFFYRKNL